MKRIFIALAATGLLATGISAQDAASVADDAAELFASRSVLTQKTGQGIYEAVCISCHMAEGAGAEGAGKYPALANNEMLAYPEYPIYITLHGQGGMPPLGSILNDEQVAAVVNYIRTNFGNDYDDPVATAEMVAASR